METFLLVSIFFVLGFGSGSYIRGILFELQEWKLYKWNKDSLGYRPMMIGSSIFRNDNIIIGMSFDTKKIPQEGIKYSTSKVDR
jgi:hypothetical protein